MLFLVSPRDSYVVKIDKPNFQCLFQYKFVYFSFIKQLLHLSNQMEFFGTGRVFQLL